MISNCKSPIQDEYTEKYLTEKELDLTATLDAEMAYCVANFVVIVVSTDWIQLRYRKRYEKMTVCDRFRCFI